MRQNPKALLDALPEPELFNQTMQNPTKEAVFDYQNNFGNNSHNYQQSIALNSQNNQESLCENLENNIKIIQNNNPQKNRKYSSKNHSKKNQLMLMKLKPSI